MKHFKPPKILLLLSFLFTSSLFAQDKDESLGLPGDNLNLYAVLKLFQESETLEGFEKKLNDENSKINNLDLDGDDKIDYIKVIDNVDGNVHTIVLQVAVSENENQDVAVFTVERDDKNRVQIQLIGDEDLYGKDYIIEPNFEERENAAQTETPNPGYTGNTQTIEGKTVTVTKTTTVQIAAWPVVHSMFLPAYVVWRSPWYWGYYPPYWHPWRPFYWHYYYGYHYNYYHFYYGHYRRWPYYRYHHWNDFYYGSRRSHSVIVINRRQNGNYKTTYSRPDLKKDGIALYNKTRPVTRPGTKPGTTRPVTRPVAPGPTKPITKPSPTKPVTRPAKPITKPAPRPAPTKPVVKPLPAKNKKR